MLGKPAETYYSPSAFDQGYLNHVGIATANFGPGENQYAHTDYVISSEEVERRGATFQKSRFCSLFVVRT
jgi:hypothetical protein